MMDELRFYGFDGPIDLMVFSLHLELKLQRMRFDSFGSHLITALPVTTTGSGVRDFS